MDEFTREINKLFGPQQEQWAMSTTDNVWGMSLPEYHPAPYEPIGPAVETEEIPSISFGAVETNPDNIADLIQQMLWEYSKPQYKRPSNLSNAFDNLLGSNPELLAKAQKQMYIGAAYKTAAAASDLFTRLLGIGYNINNIRDKRDIAIQNYDNQMAALDNQVLYIKHQLADRFNKTIENNIMTLAAKNLRVTAGNVLDLSKEQASEISEDMRTAESNARLKSIAMEAGKKSAKESATYAEKQLWTGLAQSAINLGIAYSTGGGTGENFGNLYKNYRKSKDFTKATKGGTLTSMYD